MTKYDYFETKKDDIIVCIDDSIENLTLYKYYKIIKFYVTNTICCFYIECDNKKCEYFEYKLFETVVNYRNKKIKKLLNE